MNWLTVFAFAMCSTEVPPRIYYRFIVFPKKQSSVVLLKKRLKFLHQIYDEFNGICGFFSENLFSMKFYAFLKGLSLIRIKHKLIW